MKTETKIHGCTIARVANYHGRLTAVVEWRVTRDRDGRNLGTYKTKRAALECAALYAC